ncbi:flavoprotein [Amycolatopsis suaedae]|uniref:Flavoprotein n=1 Tax=Amycolatopsis suaedae TaxID=2510978 RepID=A0A4Q7J1D5_9PSEU|nr:flavoprotein [Amycolatopsis suaedae]RZQ61211.1 flavoprotein [Amycolatopsis suaedae]
MSQRVLYVVITGAGPARHVDRLVRLAQEAGWSVHSIATPAAVEHFLDLPALTELTGHPVRTGHRKPGDANLPKADAVVVAPATYNTINKFAAGIADTYVTTQLAELNGMGVPIVVLPFVNQGLANNRPFRRAVEELRLAGVRVLLGPGEFEPHPPRTGDTVIDQYPWALALAEAERMAADDAAR